MPIDNVNVDKDYVLSCATLFSDLGFPKAAFIRMIGPEYASDIFELVEEERIVFNGLVFTFPRRNSWKKRINQRAKQHFYDQMIDEIVSFVRPYVASSFEHFDYQQTTFAELREFSSLFHNKCIESETEVTINKFHRNLGKYLTKTLERSINKMPLTEMDTRFTYSLLVCYYSIVRDFESAEKTLDQFSKIEESGEID